MAKRIDLSAEILAAPVAAPQAAKITPKETPEPAPKKVQVQHVPLQIRIPPADLKAIKRAAVEAEQTVSEFMLACFHACMQNGKQA
jgi:hypothetical protein